MCGARAGGPDASTIKPGETTIQGSVTRDGEPVTGYVRLLDSTGEFTAEVPTSATGQFRFYAAEGTWTLRALVRAAAPTARSSRRPAGSPRSPSPSDPSRDPRHAVFDGTPNGRRAAPQGVGRHLTRGAALRAVRRRESYAGSMYARRRRNYFLMMGGCIVLFVSAWAVVRLWSMPAAIAMCVVAMVIPPVAAMVANRRGRRTVGGTTPPVTPSPTSGGTSLTAGNAAEAAPGQGSVDERLRVVRHGLLHEDLRTRDAYALQHVLLRDVAPGRALGAQGDPAARQDRVQQVGQRGGVRQFELGGPARQREPRGLPVSQSETSTPLATPTAATVKACEQRSAASGPGGHLDHKLLRHMPNCNRAGG